MTKALLFGIACSKSLQLFEQLRGHSGLLVVDLVEVRAIKPVVIALRLLHSGEHISVVDRVVVVAVDHLRCERSGCGAPVCRRAHCRPLLLSAALGRRPHRLRRRLRCCLQRCRLSCGIARRPAAASPNVPQRTLRTAAGTLGDAQTWSPAGLQRALQCTQQEVQELMPSFIFGHR
eukprot:gene15516-biopygen14265